MNTYQVVRVSDKKVVAEGFASREEAKKVRNEKMFGDALNDAERLLNVIQGNVKFTYIVSRGSDHPNGASFGPVSRK